MFFLALLLARPLRSVLIDGFFVRYPTSFSSFLPCSAALSTDSDSTRSTQPLATSRHSLSHLVPRLNHSLLAALRRPRPRRKKPLPSPHANLHRLWRQRPLGRRLPPPHPPLRQHLDPQTRTHPAASAVLPDPGAGQTGPAAPARANRLEHAAP